MKKFLMIMITFVTIGISIFFQMFFLNSFPLLGITANFGIVLVAGLGLVSGNLMGGLVGSVYGILVDICYGRGVGLYTLLYACVGILAGYLNNHFSKGNKISMIMLILLNTILFETIVYLWNVFFNQFEFDGKTCFMMLILESAYNMFLTILFFKPIASLGEILNKCKNNYYLL